MTNATLLKDPASKDHRPGAAKLSAANVQSPEAPLLLEVSWEVCNQVGGIYQVVRSKVPHMVVRWQDRYCMVGPYVGERAEIEFEAAEPKGFIASALEALRREGLIVHYGRWLVTGRPLVMLIEHEVSRDRLGELRARLAADHDIQYGGGDGLVDGVISFGDGVARLVEALASRLPEPQSEPGGRRAVVRPIIAHFHEWLGGAAIPRIRRSNLPVAIVFTTHATLVGRYIASSRDDLYERLTELDDVAEAAHYAILPQHQIERACAHGAHAFTTVSAVTAEECDALLGREVDVIVPNGLTIGLYNAAHDQQRLHAEYKEQIHRFTMGHFFPSYAFDLDETLYFFTSGRFEPHNKGFDLCLDAMVRLEAELAAAQLRKTVVFFIISRVPTRSISGPVMEKRGILNELREVCEKITAGVGERLFPRAAAGEPLHLDDLVDEYWMLRYRRAQHALRQRGLPPVVTHDIADENGDPVLRQIRALGLDNRRGQSVKVVYHPDFITPTNRLWGIEYDQFVRGCHLGIFPSAYEPWGYTPLECAAVGIPAVTSDLAGFGRYVLESYEDPGSRGLHVMRRRGRSYQESAADLARYLFEFCRLDRRERITLRNEVDRTSWDFDWSELGRAYHTAHDLAFARWVAGRPK